MYENLYTYHVYNVRIKLSHVVVNISLCVSTVLYTLLDIRYINSNAIQVLNCV